MTPDSHWLLIESHWLIACLPSAGLELVPLPEVRGFRLHPESNATK